IDRFCLCHLESNQMAKLEFNDDRIDAKQGETLVQAARRHGSLVWFLCDGRGICQTCECHVIAGAENLSELSELERAGLGEKRWRSEMFGTLGPGEWRGVLAVCFQVAHQKLLQLLFGTVHALLQRLPGENAEKAFHHIHPGSVGGSVMEMHSRMTQEPLFGGFVLVDIEVVQHDAKFAD